MINVPMPDDVDFGRIDPAIGVAAYKQVVMIVLRLVERGDLAPGDPFPSGPRLCEYYGLSYYTIRHAVEQLHTRGVLVAEQGRRTWVNPKYVPPSGQQALLPVPV